MVGAELHSLYRSLLGAVAFLLLIRIDIAVFVSALQRWGHSPKVIHVKRLNALTKWIQANPRRLVYKPFVSQGDRQVDAGTHLRAYSDSAFMKEEQTGHCMRGAVFLLCPGKMTSPSCEPQSVICWILSPGNSGRWFVRRSVQN